MSKILKKFTKKYKWLRFLNYKTTKLAVLSAALFGLCLSSGHSFAKYRDENYGNGNAGAAKFEYGYITHDPSPILQPTDEQYIKAGMHAFICEFYLEIPVVEVSISFSLNLRLVGVDIEDIEAPDDKLDNTSFFGGDSEGFYTFETNSEGVVYTTDKKSVSDITGASLQYSKDYWYYAIGENKNSTISYTWNRSNKFAEDKDGNITESIAFDSGTVSAGSSLTRYYKILVFVNATTDADTWVAENSKILYSYNVLQEE